MATLRNPNEAPPGEFQYTEYRTGLRFKEHTLVDCISKVIEHRRHRGLMPQDYLTVRAEIERQICARLGNDHCKSEGPDDTWKPVNDLTLTIRLSDIMAASRALLEWLSSGLGTASMVETQSRRAICSRCSLKKPATGCKCDILFKMIAAAVPKERQFEDLHICGACGCSLKAKCSAPANVIAASEKGRNLTYPTQCWVPSAIADAK